jgi:hypothetical protein
VVVQVVRQVQILVPREALLGGVLLRLMHHNVQQRVELAEGQQQAVQVVRVVRELAEVCYFQAEQVNQGLLTHRAVVVVVQVLMEMVVTHLVPPQGQALPN